MAGSMARRGRIKEWSVVPAAKTIRRALLLIIPVLLLALAGAALFAGDAHQRVMSIATLQRHLAKSDGGAVELAAALQGVRGQGLHTGAEEDFFLREFEKAKKIKD